MHNSMIHICIIRKCTTTDEKDVFDEVFLATNYKADYLVRFVGDGSQYGVRVTVSQENKPSGMAGPLTLLHQPVVS